MSGIECHRFLRTRLYWRLPGFGEPPGVAARGSECVPSQGLRIRQAGMIGGEILHAHGYEMGEVTGADYSRV
jgi:hypothetical protein